MNSDQILSWMKRSLGLSSDFSLEALHVAVDAHAALRSTIHKVAAGEGLTTTSEYVTGTPRKSDGDRPCPYGLQGTSCPKSLALFRLGQTQADLLRVAVRPDGLVDA